MCFSQLKFNITHDAAAAANAWCGQALTYGLLFGTRYAIVNICYVIVAYIFQKTYSSIKATVLLYLLMLLMLVQAEVEIPLF